MPRGSAARIAHKTVSAAADSFPAKNAWLSPLNAPSALGRGSSGLTFFTTASEERVENSYFAQRPSDDVDKLRLVRLCAKKLSDS